MKTAFEHIPTEYVSEGNLTSPVPRYRRSWSNLRKLRWKASLIMASHPGVRLYVQKGRSWTNDIFNYGLFSISYDGRGGSGGLSPCDFDSAWEILMGIEIGLGMNASIEE